MLQITKLLRMNFNIAAILFLLLQFLLITQLAVSQSSNKPDVKPSIAAASSKTVYLRGNGLHFTPNKGQIADMDGKLCPDVLYKGDGGGSDIYLRKTGISYVQTNISELMHKVDRQIEELKAAGVLTETDKQQKRDELLQKEKVNIHRVDMDFEGANTNCRLINEDELQGYNNYYYAHCPDGVLNVKQYNNVTYKNIYNGIDIAYYGNSEKGLKYDLIVQPYADPNQIKLHWKGATELRITNGELRIKTSVNEFTETLPKVYQNINGRIVDVECKYKLEERCEMLDKRENKVGSKSHISCLQSHIYEISFELGTYNLELPLVIDPWATYFGGSNWEYGSAITTDANENVFFTGQNMGSTNFPVTAGAFQTTYVFAAAILVKLDANGNRLWATYIGGSGGQQAGISIATDAVGNVCVAGNTGSMNFPVGAAAGYFVHQNVHGGPVSPGSSGDNFLAKFDPSGARLWITFCGGNAYDNNTDLVTEGSNIYLYGNTLSPNAISTLGSFQPNLNGTQDAYIVKFAGNGIRIWGTYIGGSSWEATGGIACDNSGNICICGRTNSANFPIGSVLPNVVNQTVAANNFVAKFDPSGSRLWATYSSVTGNAADIAIDALSNVVIVTGNGLQKFNASGIQQWFINTPITGAFALIKGVAVDNANNIYVGGEWEDKDPGLTMDICAYQRFFSSGGPTGDGPEDMFIAKYDPSGVQRCFTYLGGTGEDDADYSQGNLYTIRGKYIYGTGMTLGAYPVTPGVFQTMHGGGMDAFVNKLCINLCEAKVLGLNISSDATSTCLNKPVTFTPSFNATCDTTGLRYKWTFSGGNPSSSTAMKPIVTYSSSGSYPVKLVLTTACKNDSIIKPSYISVGTCGCNLSSLASVSSNVSCSSNGSANVIISNGSGGPYTYSWSNGVNTITTSGSNTINALSAGTYSVTVTDGLCISISSVVLTQSLTINSTSKTDIVCVGGNNGSATVTVNGAAGNYSFSWSNGISSTTTSNSHSVTNLKAGTYTVTVQNGTCVSASSIIVTEPDPILVAFSNQVPCASTTGTATATPVNGTSPYTYLWSNGGTSQSLSGLSEGSYTLTVTDKNNCSVVQSGNMTIPTRISIGTSGTTNVSCTTSGYAYINFTGASPLGYVWSTGKSGVINNQSGFTNLTPAAGNYTVTITDGYGCTATKSFSITGSSPVSAAFTNPPACINTNVCFTNTGTTGTYSWSIGSPANVSGTTNNFCYTFLTAGTYSVSHTVENAGCTNTIINDVVVSNCSAPLITASANSICSGFCATVSSSPSGGTTPYTYSWSTGETTKDIAPCPASTTTYTVKVTDAGGGTATSTAVVTVSPAVTASATTGAISCSGASTGSATVTGGGGTSPYTFNWSTGATTTGTSSTIPNLPANTYSVTVTDANGCTTTTSATLVAPPPLLGQFTKGTAPCSNCGCQEWVMTNATGGTVPYTYLWPDGYDKRYKNKICPGNYTVKVTDKNGCSVVINVSTP